MNLLKRLYEIYSPSKQEKAMREFIVKYVKQIPDTKTRTDKEGNIYITKGEGKGKKEEQTYPCIVAHLDQVQRTHAKDFLVIETQDLVFGYSPKKRRFEGVGADDKNGIWIALKSLAKYDTLKVAFFVGEEIGCVGSGKADMTFFEDCRFVIEPDRKGHQDLITSISFTSLCSVEFIKDTHYEKFGYKECDGMMTDILELKERGLNISCINLSCGYYKPHTDEEYTVKKDLLGCLKFVEYIIENCQKVYPHTEELGYNRFDRDLEDLEYELFDILDMSPEITADDLYEMYQTNYPLFSREDFHAIYNEFHLLYMNDYDYEEIGLYNNNQNMELWKSVNMTD